MTHVVLFHSMLGLRPAVQHFAGQLRAAGHTVTTPDFYSGEVLEDYAAGNQKWFGIGIPVIIQQAQAACKDLSGGLVFAGFSAGASAAEFMAATDPRAQGVLLMHGVLPLSMLQVSAWPGNVAVQVHYNDQDPFRVPENDAAFETDVVASGAAFEEFLYPGSTHLFADPDLPDYVEASAQLMLARAVQFLAQFDKQPDGV